MLYYKHQIASSTDSEKITSQIGDWLRDCIRCHDDCDNQESLFWPSRLIEISGPNETCLRACIKGRQHVPADTAYATLSHIWGSVMPFKLLQQYLAGCSQAGLSSELSRGFQGTIKLAWRLDIRYLRIDSLCKLVCPR